MPSLYDKKPEPPPPLNATLRPYQAEAIAAVFGWFGRCTGNPLIVLPTGAGKSIVQAALIHAVWAMAPGERIVCLTHVKELIAQNHAALLRAWPAAPAGIYSAGIGRREHDAPILFAGIQSVHAKASKIQWADIVIVDEAHLIPTKGFGMYRSMLDALRAINPAMKVIGLTATPFRTDSGRLDSGADRMFDGIAYDAKVEALIQSGYLSTIRSKWVEGQIDTSGVHKRGGEFVESELQAAALSGDNVEQAVAEIVRRSHGRRGILVFCCGIEHAELVAEKLTAEGIACATIFGKTPQAERDAVLERFKAGELRCVVNVNVLTTGFDAPHIDLVAILRPTMSPVLYIQMVGRGLRLAPGKEDCLVLDFGGNIMRHGPINAIEVREPNENKGTGVAPTKRCETCDELVPAGVRECPACGSPFPEPQIKHDERPAEQEIIAPSGPVIERWNVRRVWYLEHRKPDKPVSLKVDYECGFHQSLAEWVCFEHTGFARLKAEQWWKHRRGQLPVPATVDEARTRIECGEITDPVSITVDTRGQWPKLLSVKLDRDPGEDEPEEDAMRTTGTVPGTDIDYGDIPF